MTPGYFIEPIKFLHPTVAKLAGQSVAVCERYCARLDMAVKTKEMTNLNLEGLVAEVTKLCSMYEGSNRSIGNN